jgi:hypothetical protein
MCLASSCPHSLGNCYQMNRLILTTAPEITPNVVEIALYISLRLRIGAPQAVSVAFLTTNGTSVRARVYMFEVLTKGLFKRTRCSNTSSRICL